jgi:hypothetical protein
MRRISWPLLMIISTVAAYLVTFQFPANIARPALVMWFLFVCPGTAIVRCFRFVDPAINWMLTVALSLTIDGAVASILLYAHWWSPTRIFKILLLFCLCGTIVQLVVIFVAQFKRARERSGTRVRQQQ